MTMQFGFPVLTALIVLPLAADGVLLFLRQERTVRRFTLVAGVLDSELCPRPFPYAPHAPGFPVEENPAWLPAARVPFLHQLLRVSTNVAPGEQKMPVHIIHWGASHPAAD